MSNSTPKKNVAQTTHTTVVKCVMLLSTLTPSDKIKIKKLNIQEFLDWVKKKDPYFQEHFLSPAALKKTADDLEIEYSKYGKGKTKPAGNFHQQISKLKEQIETLDRRVNFLEQALSGLSSFTNFTDLENILHSIQSKQEQSDSEVAS